MHSVDLIGYTLRDKGIIRRPTVTENGCESLGSREDFGCLSIF